MTKPPRHPWPLRPRRPSRRAIGVALAVAASALLIYLYMPGDLLYPPWLIHHSDGVGADANRGSVERHFITSALLSRQTRDYYVYLPPSYYRPGFSARRYPVLYLLHGAPGVSSDWLRLGHVNATLDHMIAHHQLRELIAVMPDGNGGWEKDSEYVNRWDGRQNVEDYIVYDLVHEVDSRFRTIPDRSARAIGGISEGGYGATNLGLKHRDVFATVIAFSGYFTALRSWPERWPFGRDEDLRQRNSPLTYLPTLGNLSDVALYLCAEGNSRFYRTQALRFTALLRRTGARFESHLPAGRHSWTFWRRELPSALGFLENRWSQEHLPPTANRTGGCVAG